MHNRVLKTGDILTVDGWVRGKILFGERILRIDGATVMSPEPPYILPGFVDLHCHGGGGHEVFQGSESILQCAKTHAMHGTTSLLPTTITAPIDEIEFCLSEIALVEENQFRDVHGARIIGAHLEGPFINEKKLGAQPHYPIRADVGLLKRWSRMARIRVVTIAPEVADDQFLTFAATHGAKFQIGHSASSFELASSLLSVGWGVTHLFNAMTPFRHRGNGVVGACFVKANYAEVIPDLVHVEAGAILAARRAVPFLYGVTDATAGAGAPDGLYSMAGRPARKSGDAFRFLDGGLAGSCLTMTQALRNFVDIGFSLTEASQMLSRIPADWIGESSLGRIEPNALADIVVLDDELSVAETFVGGQQVF